MTCPALLKHLGPTVAHVTAESNVALIQNHGLLPAAELARAAGLAPETLTLRDHRRRIAPPFGVVTLNHQNPINHGRKAAEKMVEGHSAESWAAQLDERVFFSRVGSNVAFAKSIAADVPTVTLLFDTAPFLDHLADRVFLSPINTGNFLQGGANARRGDWIYWPLAGGFDAYRTYRQSRNLVAGKDGVKELSVIGQISAEVLQSFNMRRA